MNRRNFLHTLTAGAGMLTCQGLIPKRKRPNIIFILTDDQRADTLALWGNRLCKTPHLDQLAKDGVVFNHASITSAICTPSRATFFSGQFERRHGVNFNSASAMSEAAWENCYPAIFKRNGYFTGYVGKNHVPVGRQGYETGIVESTFDYWYGGHGHLGFYPKDRHDMFKKAGSDTQVEILDEGMAGFLEPENNEAFLKGAADFLTSRPEEQPFHLSICFNLPHNAGTSTMQQRESDPELYKSAYRDQNIYLPDHYVARENIGNSKLPADVLRAENRQTSYNYVDTPEFMKEKLIRDAQTITGIDRLIGRVRSILDALGIADHTIILFSSDHGIMYGEWGLGGKALCYEKCLHVPMIVYDPRLPEDKQGKRHGHLVQSIDFAPTMLAWADIPIPDSMQGKDFSVLMENEAASWREAAFGENLWSNQFGNPICESVRTHDWKYIRYFKNETDQLMASLDRKKWYAHRKESYYEYLRFRTNSIHGEEPVYEELFSVKDDPDELDNLAENQAYQDVMETMRRLCQTLVEEALGPDQNPLTVPIYKQKAVKHE